MHPPTLPTAIRRKKEFAKLWLADRLGNKLRAWDSFTEVPITFKGAVMIRQRGAIGGGLTAVEIPCNSLTTTVAKICKAKKLTPDEFYYNECAPDALATLQGELLRTARGLYFLGAERKAADVGKLIRMRDAMAVAVEVTSLSAKLLLQQHTTVASYEDLMELLDMFPDHVIELTCYARNVGCRQGRNTIIWEVRGY